MRLYCTAGQGPYLGKLPVLALFTLVHLYHLKAQRTATSSCDDTPKWRETLGCL